MVGYISNKVNSLRGVGEKYYIRSGLYVYGCGSDSS